MIYENELYRVVVGDTFLSRYRPNKLVYLIQNKQTDVYEAECSIEYVAKLTADSLLKVAEAVKSGLNLDQLMVSPEMQQLQSLGEEETVEEDVLDTLEIEKTTKH